MYIVTLEEKDVQNQNWYKTYRSFAKEESALDFMQCMYECYDTTRNIQLWDVELIPHKVHITADVKLVVE